MSEYIKVEMRLGLMFRPDLNSSTRCVIPYYYVSESSSLYTCNTSWCSVHYMILNKPLVRLTTAHYQSAVSMISFAQVLTAQWSNTIPCWNVQFQVGITSHNILFQHSHEPWHDFFGESHDVTKSDIFSNAYDLLMHKLIQGPALCVMRYSMVGQERNV